MSNWFRCRCCDRPCVICDPLIWSPVRDDISDIFIERSGDWEIVDESIPEIPPEPPEDIFVLQENGNAGAVATCLAPHPFSTPTGKAFTNIFNIQDGRKYRVIINYNPTTGAYLFTELETLGSGNAILKVGSSPGGILDSTGVGYDLGETHDILVCRTLTGVYASSQDSTLEVWSCLDGWNGGRYAGVGNGGSSIVQYRAFQFNQHTYTYVIGNCGRCPCECGAVSPHGIGEHGCLPEQWLLTFIASGDCACLDGEEIPLTLIGRDPRTWAGSKELCDGNTYAFEITCDGAGGFNICDLSDQPCLGWPNGNCSYVGQEGRAGGSAEYTCDPMVIVFRPTSCQPVSAGDPNCHVEMIVIAA